MNPYDALSLPCVATADEVTAALTAALAGAGPAERLALEGALEALARGPEVRLAWLLVARRGGPLHPWDREVLAPPPELPELGLFVEEAPPRARDRSRQVAELVELPALPPHPLTRSGLPRVGSREDKDPP